MRAHPGQRYWSAGHMPYPPLTVAYLVLTPDRRALVTRSSFGQSRVLVVS